jgi:hypothetical protein
VKAFGVGTFKGIDNFVNAHHMGVHLCNIKNFMLVEGYDGSFAGTLTKN